jgi:hypothetical protein
MITRIMLDLETLGTSPGSAILSIGAVKFGRKHVLSDFYQRVDLRSCLDFGMKINPDTLFWWLQQSESVRQEITQEGIFLASALEEFDRWIHQGEAEGTEFEIWGNGAAFDNVLLSTAYELFQHPRPWKYANDRCYRTVKNLYPEVEMVRYGDHHNALDDARSQAMHLMAMLPNL